MAGFNVSGLTDYVKVNQDALVKGVVLGTVAGDTIPKLRKQFGVKTQERLNILNVDPVLQDGSNCGFNASGSTTYSERSIVTAQLKAQDSYCDRDLLGKFAEYAVKINALKDASDLPFEQVINDEVIGKINEKMESLVWRGATSGNSGTDLIDGFVTLALNQDSAATISLEIASGTSAFEAVKQVIMAIPEDLLDKATVFVDPSTFRSLAFDLVNNYKYNADLFNADIEDRDVYFPGTQVRIHKTIGLKKRSSADTAYIYASAYDNMVYGCDLENDQEKVRWFYDEKDEKTHYSIHWNAGVQTIFPDMVVLAKLK